MNDANFLGLFEGFGIELEYMIVSKNDLSILPITDEVMKAAAGEVVSDFEDGAITWSNELVAHVIELKTTGPAKTLSHLDQEFYRSLSKINSLLASHNAMLLPTAMHPFMQPTEMKLWAHDNNEIYEAYDRIFDCRGHGWSNLQSMHINLPFRTDTEFEKLHTAIRFLLPILPALTASSPIVEGKMQPAKDSRLLFYQKNQARVPSIAGQVIPELVSSMDDYHNVVLKKIYADIAPHDPEEQMREDWLNSRGAIARFGRQTIEIRVLDIQEAPSIDLAVADFICAVLKTLISEPVVNSKDQKKFSTTELKEVFDLVSVGAEEALISNKAYLSCFGLQESTSAKKIWSKILSSTPEKMCMSTDTPKIINSLISRGTLATRIQKAIPESATPEQIKKVYFKLADCLRTNTFFEGISL